MGINGLRVVDIERTVVRIPFVDRCRPWTEINCGQWGVVEVIRLSTNSPDVVGYGETLRHYTPGRVSDAAIAAVLGGNPADFLGRDDLGAGLQMALYDAVGKALGVPAHRLFGPPRVRDRVPIAWWSTKMPAEVLADEAAAAVSAGYTDHKFKARPWFDVYDQVAAVSAATPQNYGLDLDWNEMLLTAGNAIPVLRELARSDRVRIFETPIRFGDLEGYRRIRDAVDRPVADHVKQTPFAAAVRAEAFDGYVLEGGVATAIRDGLRADAFNKSYWLQFVGPGLTTALAVQLGAVLPGATWPAVTCLNIYTESLLAETQTVHNGYVTVPDGPGLGVTVDESAISRLAMQPPYTVDYPRTLLTVRWPNDRACTYHDVRALWTDTLAGNMPVAERGARLEIRYDDGSAEFAALVDRAAAGPVRE